MHMRIQFIWVVFTILVTSCWADKYFSAPRSESGFGSKRLLRSYASYMQSNTNFKIVEYNEDLSSNGIHVVQTDDYWWNVQACDQFYLALSIPTFNPTTATLVLLMDDGQTLLSRTNITLNITKVYVSAQIAVAPSGMNFVFMNGTHLIVFEIDAQKLNWTITEEVSLSNYINLIHGKVVMSDSKIGFIYNGEKIVFYNYKNHTFTTLSLQTNLIAIDTYEDYWLFTSNNLVALENPDGKIQTFNNFTFFVSDPVILSSPLRETSEFVDIATQSSLDFFSGSPTVTFGTLNTKTMQYEPYNTLPSKSLGLLIDPAPPADSKNSNTLLFGVGYNAIIYQLPNREEYPFTFSVPSLPGNHSCTMNWENRLDTFWCSNKHISEPTSPCPKGTYQPSTGLTTCLLCPEGTYQPNQGSIQCLPCLKEEFCPLGTYLPEVISNVTSHVTWDFPITEAAAPSFEEILLMLLFASSVTSNSISVVLLGSSIITAVLLISYLIKHCWGINLHQWLAKIDIHKKTKYKTTVKPSGSFKTEAVKVESVFGGYLTLLAGFILLVGLITTIIFVNDYHPLLVGDNAATVPSHNSVRAASLQDYNTQSKASDLANVIKNNYHLNISFTAHNIQDYYVKEYNIDNCYDQYGQDCFEGMSNEKGTDTEHTFSLKMKGSVQSSQVEVTFTLDRRSMFTWAAIEIQSELYDRESEEDKFQPSSAKYLILPGENQVLSGQIIVPVTMTVVVRETQIKEEEFNRHGYMSFVADQGKLHNMGHSAEAFEMTNDPITIQLLLELDNNWRLESEQQRFSGIGAFFAALLAILGLYEVTLLASELAHRVFHSIEKRHKKRSKYEVLEEGPLIVNEKSE